jgi:hypothetical protein
LVPRASQVENVVLAGENTKGCLTFGNISAHQLPHARLVVQLPIKSGFSLDLLRRGGIAPDLWVPAADAVVCVVAAVRIGVGFMFAGIVGLASGGINVWRTHRASPQASA